MGWWILDMPESAFIEEGRGTRRMLNEAEEES
jgi:hypothetical protein